MSANNQILVKEHKGKWYVFNNVTAESWCDENGGHENEISKKDATKIFETEQEALNFAFLLDNSFDEWGPNSEYGVHYKLAKDGADVKII